MNRREAIDFVRHCVVLIGAGFHPDTAIADYETGSGTPLFDRGRAEDLQRELDEAFDVLGPEVYDAAYDAAVCVGCTVKFFEVVDPGDDLARFTVTEMLGDRCVIRLICSLPIAPTRVVMVRELIKA